MTEDLSAVLRRLDTLERNVSDHASSLSSVVNESNRLERILDDRTPSEATMKFLTELRPEEVETLRVLGRMDEDERVLLFDAIELTKSARRTARFLKWLAFGLLGIFLFFNQLSEQIGKLLATFQGGPK